MWRLFRCYSRPLWRTSQGLCTGGSLEYEAGPHTHKRFKEGRFSKIEQGFRNLVPERNSVYLSWIQVLNVFKASFGEISRALDWRPDKTTSNDH